MRFLVWIGEPTGCHPDDQQHRCTAVSRLDAVNDAERAGMRGPVWCVCTDGPTFEVFEYVIPEGRMTMDIRGDYYSEERDEDPDETRMYVVEHPESGDGCMLAALSQRDAAELANYDGLVLVHEATRNPYERPGLMRYTCSHGVAKVAV